MAITKDLGIVSAYGYAVEKGYTGTEEEFAELMYNVAESAGTSEAWAVGSVGGVPVEEGAEQYQNNAKYYAEQAGGDAENAEQSKDSAKSSADTSEAWAVGTVGGVPVEEGQTGYNNNAKYYAEQASDSKEAAANSEAAAKNYSDHIADPVSGIVTEWLNEHVDPESQVVIDDSLTIAGAAADAKATGDELTNVKSAINYMSVSNLTQGLTVETNKYINYSTGATESNTSHAPNAVSGIPVEGDALIVKLSECEVAGYRGLAFYDSLGAFITGSGVGYTVGQRIYVVNVPTTAKTMALTTFGSDNVFSIQFLRYQSTDKTLKMENKPADAKSTGDAIDSVKEIAETNYSLLRSALTITETTYTDTPDRGVSGTNNGFILSDALDICSIKITPLFSSSTNPYTNVESGTFKVRFYSITRSGDTVTLGEQIGSDVSYNIGDEVDIPYFDGTMLFDIREAKDSDSNIVKVAYIQSGKTWGNNLVNFSNDATTVTVWTAFGIGGQCVITRARSKEGQQLKSILNGKNITVIGDSITEHNYRAVTNWAMWLSQWTGAIVQNLGISGSGFIRTSPYVNRISQIQAAPDIIGIAMSWNDLSDQVGLPIGDADDTGTSSVAGYVNDFFTALITAYPTTPIVAYIQSPWNAYRPGVAIAEEYISVMTELLSKQGIPFYKDLYYGSALRPWLADNKDVYYKVDDSSSAHYGETDGIHPNSEGHKVIARYLYPKFAGNIVSIGLNYYLE